MRKLIRIILLFFNKKRGAILSKKGVGHSYSRKNMHLLKRK